MGQQIEITPLEDSAYGVQVTEDEATTTHRVRVPAAMLDDLGIVDADHERVVRASFEFLLEREPASSILGDFDLDQIAHYFPEYYEELRTRLTG